MSHKEKIFTIFELYIKPFKNEVYVIFPFWYTLLLTLYTNPNLSFLFISPLNILILITCPFLILFGIFLIFYFKFDNICLFGEKYFFRPDLDTYYPLPSLIISEFFITRFSFKLKLYGDIFSKIQGKRLALIIIKAPTINIFIKIKSQLNQKYNDDGNIFYLTQDYELNSSQLSFVLFIQADGAVDTKELELYMVCEDSLQEFLEEFKIHPEKRPSKLISKEKFYLSTQD